MVLQSKSGATPNDSSRIILLTNESTFAHNDDEESKPVFCKLRHPKSDEAALYLFTKGDTVIDEVLCFKEDCRSWIIENTIQKDGSLYITTPMDALFLVLPYLHKAAESGKYQMLDQLLVDEEFHELHRLCTCVKHQQLEKITQHKGDDDIRAYRYCKDSTMSWLKTKVERLAIKLKSKAINVSSDSHAACVIRTATDEEYTYYAHGMVSDYLPASVSEDLREYMGIKVIVHEKPSVEEPAAKRPKKGSTKPLEDYSQNVKLEDPNKNENLSKAQKKLVKVDKKGMKNISSFFSPKTKK